MSIEQILVLAIVQGLTEFLPVSSSGHLILVPAFTGWDDQGQVTDVMVHVGSLFAVIAYFWRDCLNLAAGGIELVRGRLTERAKLAGLILVATIPALAFGGILEITGASDAMRGVEIVAWNAVIFGVLLYVADVVGPRIKVMEDVRLPSAVLIGLAQAVALVPGTSRSGITMTAARFMGFRRDEAARFSFLLGIPAIAAAGPVQVDLGLPLRGRHPRGRIVGGLLHLLRGHRGDRHPDGGGEAHLVPRLRALPAGAGAAALRDDPRLVPGRPAVPLTARHRPCRPPLEPRPGLAPGPRGAGRGCLRWRKSATITLHVRRRTFSNGGPSCAHSSS